MGSQGSQFLPLQLLKGVSSFLQDEACMGAGLVAVGSMLLVHPGFCAPQTWRHQSSELAIKRWWGSSGSYWGLWSGCCWLWCASALPPVNHVLAKENNDKGDRCLQDIFSVTAISAANLSYACWHFSVPSAHLLKPGRHWTGMNWAFLRAAQLSGGLNESSHAKWQSTSGLATRMYYTCLSVPCYYSLLPWGRAPLCHCREATALAKLPKKVSALK